MSTAVLAHVIRSGFVESVHHGSAVALGADGESVVGLGRPEVAVFPRSANKPLQAVALLRAGLNLDGHLLALAASSHSGERYHRDGVLRILSGAGLSEQHLATPADLPLDPVEADVLTRAGQGPSRLAHNCSGKHAAMLATCVVNGWPLDGHLKPDHPLQRHIADTVTDLAGQPPAATGVDGCGAPVLALALTGLARAFARIATATDGSPERRLADAIRTHPEWLGGTGRDVTELIRAVPGLIAKEGHEGVFAAALPDGRACAVKIADGAARPRGAVLAALLRRLGVDEQLLPVLAPPAQLGGGRPVGRVEVVGI